MKYYITQEGKKVLSEKSISKMVRGGEYEDGDNPKTPQAAYKQTQSLERAERTIKGADASEKRRIDRGKATPEEERRSERGGPPSKRARRSLKRKPKAARRLRVPTPLEGEEGTQRTAAVISKRSKK
tara:strand:- start:1327 stop:1707 length:381 start_codon:yes stop_codon:yes gene_type:complete